MASGPLDDDELVVKGQVKLGARIDVLESGVWLVTAATSRISLELAATLGIRGTYRGLAGSLAGHWKPRLRKRGPLFWGADPSPPTCTAYLQHTSGLNSSSIQRLPTTSKITGLN